MARNNSKKTVSSLRILLNVCTGISIFFFSWWVVGVFIIISMVFFDAYEVIVWAFLADTLYATGIPAYFDFEYVFTIMAIALFLVSTPIKKRIMYYD